MNPHTHEVRHLDALTEQERANYIAEHEQTRQMLEKLFPAAQAEDPVEAQRKLDRAFRVRPTIPGAPGQPDRKGSFDALGRPRW